MTKEHDLDRLLANVAMRPVDERIALARTIIDRYDADFDVLNRRHVALGTLEILIADVNENTNDPGALATLVGAAWCRIVDADVEYDLLRGLELIKRSRRLTEELEKQRNEAGDWQPFATYVLVRWHDAAGKINFRCGDMQGASKLFGRAVELAGSDQDRCIADMHSNLVRAKHDAAAQVNRREGNDKLRLEFEGHLAEAESATRRYSGGLSLEDLRQAVDVRAASWWSPRGDPLEFPTRPVDMAGDHQRRERIRGLSSIEHNLSIVLKAIDGNSTDRSLTHSRRSALYAYAIADGYRFAQALRHMTTLLDAKDACREVMSSRLLGLPWPRGRWMAKQHLGEYFTATKNAIKARELLEESLRGLLAQQQERGGDLGVDVDVFYYTAAAYHNAGATPEQSEEWELSAARSMRRAVKAALYRRRFKDNVLPLYTRAIERRANGMLGRTDDPEKIEELLGLIEETTARELLDLLAGRRAASDEGSPVGARKTMVLAPTAEGDKVDRGGLRDDGGTTSGLEACLLRDRVALEQIELERAAAAGEIDPDVGQALRRLTASSNGPTVVRYLNYGSDSRLAVAVIGAGKVQAFQQIRNENGQTLTLTDLEDKELVGKLPSNGEATWLWTTFLQPIWHAVNVRGELAQLVIIPAPGMFALPLHVALVPREQWPTNPLPDLPAELKYAPLGAVTPLCFTVSATAFVTRQRHLLRTQPFDQADDLCALVPWYEDASRRFAADELKNVGWRPDRSHRAGRAVAGTPTNEIWAGDRGGLKDLLRTRAEVFVFAGHGSSTRVDSEVEVALELDETKEGRQFLTQYALLSDGRLLHNKWTLLNACVSGTGTDKAARAEVAGFLKAFIAAGAGALTVTLWPVRNDAIVEVAGELLRDAAVATQEGASVDIVTRLREIQCKAFRTWEARAPGALRLSTSAGSAKLDSPGSADYLHACPMVLYL